MSTMYKKMIYKAFFLIWFSFLALLGKVENNERGLNSSDELWSDVDISFEQLVGFEQAHNLTFSDLTKGPLPLNPILLALGIVESPLWNHTKAPAGRDILYLLPHKITAVEYGGFAWNLFFNMTDQMHVTFNSLLDIENATPNRQEFLELFVDFLPEGTAPRDIEQLLPLFEKITLQERKFGLFSQGAFVKGPFTLQWNTSMQGSVRNFWLSKADQSAVKELFREAFGGGEFDEREGYILRYGCGDTRVKFGLNTINMTSFQFDVGFESIWPTSRFSDITQPRTGLATVAFDIDKIQENVLDTLRDVRDYILNPQLGIGHFGVGCYFEAKIGMFHDKAHLWVRVSHDVLFEGDENRAFMFKQVLTPDDLTSALQSTDDNKKKSVITDYTRQYIFPSLFSSAVIPGGITNAVVSVDVDFSPRWKGAFGYDFYMQQQELIKKIHNTETNMHDLRIQDAQAPSVQQHKIFGELFYRTKIKDGDFGFGMGGDVTVASQRIGEDWTVYVKIAGTF